MGEFYDIAVEGIDGSSDLLGRLRGKVTLAVNVASRCGFTSQYAGLQRLHSDLNSAGFTVIGFPCNQFGQQEPGSHSEIAQFCHGRYGVTFLLSVKLEVNGTNRHKVYEFLTSSPAGSVGGDITWNFEKFLIGRNGAVLTRYPPATLPQDSQLLRDITKALQQ